MAKIQPTLFPIVRPALPAGMCRMAAESEHLDAGHDVEFRSLGVRSVLNRSTSKRMLWMAWSINPYRGCEFGCRYCYARYTHEFLAPAEPQEEPLRGVLDDVAASGEAEGGADGERMDLRHPEAFERRIFIKSNAAWLLEQDLRRLAKQGRLQEEIALGTATDPWQPIERRTGLTRSLLEVLASRDGLRIGMVTKSTLIERDMDLLLEIHRRSTLVVHITVTTPDAELARVLEPRAPQPDLRLRTVKRLREAGLRVGILNCPLLPGITDSPEAIDRMAARAKEVDACFFAANPLFLKPCSRPTYFAFVREHFPHLEAEYEQRFRHMDFAARPYRERLRALVSTSCQRHGLRPRVMDELLTRDAGEKKPPERVTAVETQQRLFG